MNILPIGGILMRLLIFCDECKKIVVLEPKYQKINQNNYNYIVLEEKDSPLKEADFKIYSCQEDSVEGIKCIPYCISFKCPNCGQDGLMIYYNEASAKRMESESLTLSNDTSLKDS